MQHLCIKFDNINKAHKIDIKEFIDFELGALLIALVCVEEDCVDESTTTTTKNVLEEGYSKDLQKIVQYLTTLRRLEGIERGEFQAFKKRALLYIVIDRQLYWIGNKNIPSCIVVDLQEKRTKILKELHNESRHKGRESTYYKVASRYY